MDDDFLEKLKKDLEKSGFSSELKARNIFKNRGFGDNSSYWDIETSNVYFDRDENKSREIDISAYSESNLSDHYSYIIYVISCEIKKSKNPWIVFKDKSTPYREGSLFVSYSLDDHQCETFINNTKSLAKHMKYRGSGIHEAFKNPDQPSKWYSAFISAVKAACDKQLELQTDFDNDPTDTTTEFSKATIDIFQPIVVLDGTLLSAEIDDNNEIIIDEERYISFQFEYVSKEYKKRTYTVDLVSIDYLDEYLYYTESRINELSDRFYEYLEKENNIKIPEKGIFRYKYSNSSPKSD